jgi:hypothetical protein
VPKTSLIGSWIIFDCEPLCITAQVEKNPNDPAVIAACDETIQAAKKMKCRITESK